jgi:hypothetical protein
MLSEQDRFEQYKLAFEEKIMDKRELLIFADMHVALGNLEQEHFDQLKELMNPPVEENPEETPVE